MSIELEIPEDGYLSIINISEQDEETLLFPNAYERDERVSAGRLAAVQADQGHRRGTGVAAGTLRSAGRNAKREVTVVVRARAIAPAVLCFGLAGCAGGQVSQPANPSSPMDPGWQKMCLDRAAKAKHPKQAENECYWAMTPRGGGGGGGR